LITAVWDGWWINVGVHAWNDVLHENCSETGLEVFVALVMETLENVEWVKKFLLSFAGSVNSWSIFSDNVINSSLWVGACIINKILKPVVKVEALLEGFFVKSEVLFCVSKAWVHFVACWWNLWVYNSGGNIVNSSGFEVFKHSCGEVNKCFTIVTNEGEQVFEHCELSDGEIIEY
jgi:hypothetical protein